MRCSPLILFLLCAAGATCATSPAPQLVRPLDGAGQLVLVTVADWQADTGILRRFERIDGRWSAVAEPYAVTVGRNGTAWGLGLQQPQIDGPQKHEGDGKAPAGVFAIGIAFGSPPAIDSGLRYRAMDASDWCIDVSGSPYYNRIVSTGDVGEDAVKGSTEPMRRDIHLDGDPLYRKGFIIGHNSGNSPGRGSCIFAHLWRGPGVPTAGCTAMPEPDMDALLAWLDADKHPLFVLLPEPEYRRLLESWQLPELNP